MIYLFKFQGISEDKDGIVTESTDFSIAANTYPEAIEKAQRAADGITYQKFSLHECTERI